MRGPPEERRRPVTQPDAHETRTERLSLPASRGAVNRRTWLLRVAIWSLSIPAALFWIPAALRARLQTRLANLEAE